MTAARAPEPTDPAGDHRILDTHVASVAGGPHSLDGQWTSEIHSGHAVEGPNIRVVHSSRVSHTRTGGAEQSPHSAIGPAEPKVGTSSGARPPSAPATPHAPSMVEAPVLAGPILADPFLGFAAATLDDLEAVRTASENRLRQITRTASDKDGEERGFGLPVSSPQAARMVGVVRSLLCQSELLEELGLPKPRKHSAGARLADGTRATDGCCMEHDAERELSDRLKKHPLGPWIKQQRNVGDKQAARLLAAIRDPYWNDLHGRSRTVSELWQYCGHGDPVTQRRRKGMTELSWSPAARQRLRMIAKSCKKGLVQPCARPDGQAWAEHTDSCACSRYRLVYDRERRRYAGTVHDRDCVQCGPSGSPALAGSPRSPKHLDVMAERHVGKELLRDLWREAKRLHDEEAAT